MELMARWERDLVILNWRVEVIGKRRRTVPVLMTSFMKKCMDVLLRLRENGNVITHPRNKFFFAVPSDTCLSHIRGCDALRDHSQKCGAK